MKAKAKVHATEHVIHQVATTHTERSKHNYIKPLSMPQQKVVKR